MREVTRYISDDGREFRNKSICINYEKLIEDVNQIMLPLPPKPDKSDFINGHGFVQHDSDTFKKVKNRLRVLIGEKHNITGMDDEHISAMLEGTGPLDKAWTRIYNTDSYNREWGQHYYALHPYAGEQIQLN